jgi:hypothetical protein
LVQKRWRIFKYTMVFGIDARLDATGVQDVSGLPRGVYWVAANGAVGRMVKE